MEALIVFSDASNLVDDDDAEEEEEGEGVASIVGEAIGPLRPPPALSIGSQNSAARGSKGITRQDLMYYMNEALRGAASSNRRPFKT